MIDVSLPFLVGTIESFESCGLNTTGHRTSNDGKMIVVHAHDKRVNKTMQVKFKLYNDIISYPIDDIHEMMLLPEWKSESDDPLTLETYIMDKVMLLKAQCELTIAEGFESDCTGVSRHYDCQSHDQANIMGQCMSALMEITFETNNSIGFKISGDFECTQFTPAQMIQLGVDMRTHITIQVNKIGSLIGSLYSAKSKGDVDAIKW